MLFRTFVVCLTFGTSLELWFSLVNETTNTTAKTLVGRNNPSLATAVVNSQVLTIFNYNGNQIYIYDALSNENENRLTPQKWVFYCVPIIMPVSLNNPSDPWAFTVCSEVRIRLMLSNQEVEEPAHKAIMKKYDASIGQYSAYWDVALLMIDSLMAYVVRGTNLPIEGVRPYRAAHPNQLAMVFRVPCSSADNAREIIEKIIDGDYEIEISFYFAGFRQVSTNIVSITVIN